MVDKTLGDTLHRKTCLRFAVENDINGDASANANAFLILASNAMENNALGFDTVNHPTFAFINLLFLVNTKPFQAYVVFHLPLGSLSSRLKR